MPVSNTQVDNSPIHSAFSLSEPSFRAFQKIVKLWRLDCPEAMVLVDEPSEELYKAWVRDPRHVLLSELQIKRISYLVSIHHAAQECMDDGAEFHEWLKQANSDSIFLGISPLEYLLRGDVEKLNALLFYLT